MNRRDILHRSVYPAALTEVEKILATVEAVSEDRLTAKKGMQLQLALEEAVVNIIHYAYVGVQGMVPVIEVTVWCSTESLQVEIVDFGNAYNPLEMKDPIMSDQLEERKVGGLGIYFIRQVVDVVQYQRVDQANRLVLMMKLANA